MRHDAQPFHLDKPADSAATLGSGEGCDDMQGTEREMGEILARLTEIERRLSEQESDRRDDHRAIIRMSESLAILAAKFPAVATAGPALPPPSNLPQVAGVGGAAGVIGAAILTKVFSYFGIQ